MICELFEDAALIECDTFERGHDLAPLVLDRIIGGEHDEPDAGARGDAARRSRKADARSGSSRRRVQSAHCFVHGGAFPDFSISYQISSGATIVRPIEMAQPVSARPDSCLSRRRGVAFTPSRGRHGGPVDAAFRLMAGLFLAMPVFVWLVEARPAGGRPSSQRMVVRSGLFQRLFLLDRHRFPGRCRDLSVDDAVHGRGAGRRDGALLGMAALAVGTRREGLGFVVILAVSVAM